MHSLRVNPRASARRVARSFVALAVVPLLLFSLSCKKPRKLTADLAVENKVKMQDVVLFFESPDLLLVPEHRNLPLPANTAGALSVVVRELFKGSSNASVPRLFPPDTAVRGVFLLADGTAFVDLGGTTLTQGWGTGSHQELMAVYSVVQTITSNFGDAKRVRILVNGEPAETLAGHINLSKALSALGPTSPLLATSVAAATPTAAAAARQNR